MTVPYEGVQAYPCPHCGAVTAFDPLGLWTNSGNKGGGFGRTDWRRSVCTACQGESLWKGSEGGFQRQWPDNAVGPVAHASMPADVIQLYDEARQVGASSPRAAAALLRLALETLTRSLAPGERDLDAAIAALVANGLPVRIQQAMDTLRVIGNEAVHPSEIRLEENPETVAGLFMLLNAIVDNQIAQPAAIAEIYATLPSHKVTRIDARDGRNK